MGWFGKVVGGLIGFAAGGPLGAAIGVGLGHGVDWLAEGVKEQPGDGDASWDRAAVRDLEVDAEYVDDGVGLLCEFHVRAPLPGGSHGVARVLAPGGAAIPGRPPFAAAGGDFFAAAPILGDRCRLYVPFGALGHPDAGPYGLLFSALHAPPGSADFAVLGTAAFNVRLPPPRRWSRIEWLRPLIDLAMSVVHADGKVLPAEVRTVKTYFTEVFELEGDEIDALRSAMKQEPPQQLEEIVAAVGSRLPALGVAEVLAVLADISACDGEVHPAEVDVIRRAAILMGVQPGDWEPIARELGLVGGPSAVRQSPGAMAAAEAYRVLGVAPGASRAEIQAAYRKLVTEYHPDRVTNLPGEFQKLAHEKMTQINAAYDTLKKG